MERSKAFVLYSGSQLNAFVLTYLGDNTQAIPDGYYFDMITAIDTAYAMGKTAASIDTTNISVKYNVNHTHGDYCYPIASYSLTRSQFNGYGDDHDNDSGHDWDTTHVRYTATCSICGGSYSGEARNRHKNTVKSETESSARSQCISSFNSHLIAGGRCSRAGYKCGKAEGTQTVTDVSTLGAGDSVISATIEF